jgi:putative ABC transport system permease protein
VTEPATTRRSERGWRLAARIARREVRRRPGRTALVASLVAVPVAGMLVGVVLLRTNEVSDAEDWRNQFGRADAVIVLDTSVDPVALPPGSREVELVDTQRIVATADGQFCRCGISNVPFVPLTEGMITIRDGRAPTAPDEVLLSPDAADTLGTGLGERIELTQPVALDATVVGLGDRSQWVDDQLVVVPPGTELPPRLAAEGTLRLVDLPAGMTPGDVAAFEGGAGPHMMSPAFPEAMSSTRSGENATLGVRWTWVAGAVGLTVLGIVISAAFAASARRQLTTLGQLAANGATPALLRRVLFLQGTVTGVIGTAAGLAIGGALLVGARERMSDLVDRSTSGWDVRLFDLVPIVVIGIGAATAAALVPAFGASRVSVLRALAGRRPLGRVSRGQTMAGLGLGATGLGMLGVVANAGNSASNLLVSVGAVLGPVLLLFGVCLGAPAYVTVLRPIAVRLRGPWRLAARSLTRQRTRTSAMLAGICAISAVAVAVAAVGLANLRRSEDDRIVDRIPTDLVRLNVQDHGGFQDSLVQVPEPAVLDDVADEAAAVLPGAERHDIREAVAEDGRTKPVLSPRDFVPTDPDDADLATRGLLMPQQATIVDAGFEAAYGLDAGTRRLLARTGAVWVGPVPGRVVIDAVTGVDDPYSVAHPTASFPADVVGPEDGHGFGSSGELLLTPAKADELGWPTARAGVVFRTPDPLTAEQRDAVEDVELAIAAEGERATDADPLAPISGRSVWLDIERPELQVGDGLVETVPTAVALLFALLVLAVGLALAAVETRDERDVLAALGAPPRILRRTSGCKAFLLTVLGGAIAVPVGLLPVAVFTRLDDDTLPLVVPWRTIGLLVVVIPLVAMLLTSTATRTALRFRPVHVSTATFD